MSIKKWNEPLTILDIEYLEQEKSNNVWKEDIIKKTNDKLIETISNNWLDLEMWWKENSKNK